MSEYISKPFDGEELIDKIGKLLNLKEKTITTSEKTIPDTYQKKYSLDKLNTISRGNKEFVTKIINLFLEETPKSLEQLALAIKEKNFQKVRAVAHKMKPSINMMCIDSLSVVIQNIEEFAADNINLNDIPALIEEVTNTCNEVIAELQKE